MKKIAISLIALAAISTASFAADHSDDQRGSDFYFGKYETQLKDKSTSANAMIIAKKEAGTLTAFERMNMIAWENENEGDR